MLWPILSQIHCVSGTTMSEQRVIVIGGGVVGVACAYELARAGEPVVLIERSEIAGEASGGNAGQMAIGHPPIPRPGLALQALKWMFDSQSPLKISPKAGLSMIPWLWRFWRACDAKQVERSMRTLSEMGRQTKPLFDEWASREGIDCDFRDDGILDVYRSTLGAGHGRTYVELMRSFGFEVEWMAGAEVESREPALRPGVVGAVMNNESMSLDPASFVKGLAGAATRCGANRREHTPVKCLVVRDGAVVGVELCDGEVIQAKRVVLAAGVWSSELARAVGARIPMQGGKGYHRDIVQDEPRLTTSCVLAERFIAATPMGGRLRLAGTLEFTGVNHVIRQKRLEALTIGASEYMTGVEDKPVISEWCGLRPCAADGLPIIGWAPRVEGLCVATGHAMLGMTLGPITGKLVRQLVTGEKPSVDLTPMRVDRF